MLVLSSCSTDPVPLEYDKDQCDLCKMTISEVKFGAEIVTKKGKPFKYDAVECMLNAVSLGNVKTDEIGGYFVIDAANPKLLTDAVKATYLISDNFPSPMGANLSAFANKPDAEKFQKDFGGELKTWDDLLIKFKVK